LKEHTSNADVYEALDGIVFVEPGDPTGEVVNGHGRLPNGVAIVSDKDVSLRRKLVYIDYSNGESAEEISKKYEMSVDLVEDDIEIIETKLESMKKKAFYSDSDDIKLKCLFRLERLYNEGFRIFNESEKPKDRIESLKFLRGVAKDERDFMVDIGMVKKNEKSEVVSSVMIDGVPVSKMPMQDLVEKVPLEIKKILGMWLKDKEAKKLIDKVEMTFSQVRYEE